MHACVSVGDYVCVCVCVCVCNNVCVHACIQEFTVTDCNIHSRIFTGSCRFLHYNIKRKFTVRVVSTSTCSLQRVSTVHVRLLLQYPYLKLY